MFRASCPVCTGSSSREFLSRTGVPVHQNLVMSSEASALAVPLGDLRMTVCPTCGFVFNAAFDRRRLRYGEEYDNTQTCSPYFKSYIDGLVRHLVEERGISNKVVVEVGCGKGDFIRALVAYPGAANVGIGFDPSYVGPDEELDGRLKFHRTRYGDDCTNIAADVVVCRHVIEHIEDPISLLRSVRDALRANPATRVFFETPCVDWILRHQVIWDFFYEHCSLFSQASMRTAFERAGFHVEQVDSIFQGQYLWLEGRPSAEVRIGGTFSAGETEELAISFSLAKDKQLSAWKARVIDLGKRGRVALWGAGAKGATFASLVDPGRQLIDCVVDLNPAKQHRFVPGTGHPIVPYDELPQRGVTSAILMNPNYRVENAALLERAGIDVQLFD